MSCYSPYADVEQAKKLLRIAVEELDGEDESNVRNALRLINQVRA